MELDVLDRMLQDISLEIELQKRFSKPFNVFDIVGVGHYETRHSSILAGLLGWNGSRKPLSIFLKECLDENIQESELNDIKVSTEYTIDNGRRLDILLQIGKELFVVIENKIYTNDHTDQLRAYSEWLKKQQERQLCMRTKLVYLTLNGDSSSDGFSDAKLIRLSYKKDIRNFLISCTAITHIDQRFNNTVLQYEEFWENWFMESDELKRKVLEEILKSKENYQAAEQVYNNFRDAKYKLIKDLLQKWQDMIVQTYGYKPLNKACEINSNESYQKMSFKWNDKYIICFEFVEKYCSNLIYGILAKNNSLYLSSFEREGWRNDSKQWPAFKAIINPEVRSLGYNSSMCFSNEKEIIDTLKTAFEEILKLLEDNKAFFGDKS